jgi:hypothetical protein
VRIEEALDELLAGRTDAGDAFGGQNLAPGPPASEVP